MSLLPLDGSRVEESSGVKKTATGIVLGVNNGVKTGAQTGTKTGAGASGGVKVVGGAGTGTGSGIGVTGSDDVPVIFGSIPKIGKKKNESEGKDAVHVVNKKRKV